MDPSSRLTLRVPRDFHAEVEAAARQLGVSFNALVLVAVRDYLDRRQAAPGPAIAAPAEVVELPPEKVVAEPVERPRSDLKVPGGAQVPGHSRKRRRKGKR